jgi:hypothetical protein
MDFSSLLTAWLFVASRFPLFAASACFLPLLVAVSISASRCRFWLPFGGPKPLYAMIST